MILIVIECLCGRNYPRFSRVISCPQNIYKMLLTAFILSGGREELINLSLVMQMEMVSQDLNLRTLNSQTQNLNPRKPHD